MGECPLCGESTNKPSTRLIKESCGHSKCRLCLLNEESGCSVCEGNNGDISLNTIESIGNFDYRLPTTTLPNYKELYSSPRKLDFNKIPDDFQDCPLDEERLAIDDSITQNLENVVTKVPGPEKVDISTETESIVAEEKGQLQSIQQNTHSYLSQVTQAPTQSVTKLTEVFPNAIKSNHPPQQETSVVQNTSFIPVTQRPDGRQFITIAFIANSSPNKNQHVVTPLLNQCVPTMGNLATVQRPGGNQCIPMIGNINALQNPGGSQFIIRNPNIVQNLVGNQSIPIIGNLNALPNLTGNQPVSMIANVNAAKNFAANQPLPSFSSVNAAQTQIKSQPFSTPGSPNVVRNTVGNQSYQITQAVPKAAENLPALIQENVNAAQKPVRIRGLPRIKTVKNVNIVQKSVTNQSDKIISQIEKNPIQGKRGKRQRKELPVYLVPKKSNEKTISVPAKNPTQIVGCMSPEYNLEDYLLFNNQQNTNDATTKNSEIQTETNYTQMINKPSESVITESLMVSNQYNCVMEKKLVEENVRESEQEDQVLSDKTNEEKNIKVHCTETGECKEHQDLSVIFNIRDEDKQVENKEIGDEKEKLKIPNGETSKEEFQSLDVLFDIIEKESKKLNGGIFDKEVKHDIDEVNEENQELSEKMNNQNDTKHMLEQTVNIEGEKSQNLNNRIYSENSESQPSSKVMDHQKVEIETVNKEISVNEEICNNPHETSYEQNLIGQCPLENSAMQHLDKEPDSQEEKHEILNTEMEYVKEKSKTLNDTKEYQNLNRKVLDDIVEGPVTNNEIEIHEINQTLNEEVGVRKENANMNVELCHETEVNKCIEKEIFTKDDNDRDENKISDNKEDSQYVNENIDDKENSKQTLYEDISDEENDSKQFNSENQGLETTTEESNDEEANLDKYLSKKTIEEESQILNKKVDSQDEKIKLNSTTYQEESVSLPLDVKEDSPMIKTSDPDNDELHVICQNGQSDIVKKRRGRPKKSLHNDEQTLPAEVENREKNEEDENRCVPTNRDESIILDNKVNSDEIDQSLIIETPNEADESLHENANLPLTETENSEDKSPDAVTENAELIVVKKPRGRKKKSMTSDELDKSEISHKNQQSNLKKPRGRPKKSLLNLEQPNSLQETIQPSLAELPGFCEENNREESQHFDEKVDNKQNQILSENDQVHNKEEENEISRMDMHNRGDEGLDSGLASNLTTIKKNDIRVENSDLVYERKLEFVTKKPRGRPKSKNVLRNFDEQHKSKVWHDNEQPIVKKSRGRPKKSLSSIGQLEAKLSIMTEPQALGEKISNEEDKEQQFNDKNEQILDTNVFSSEKSQNLSVQMDDDRNNESLLSSVNTNSTLTKKIVSNDQKPDTANGNEQLMVIKKPRGRPKKSLGSSENVKKLRDRPIKSSFNDEQPNERDVSQEQDNSIATEISNECGTIDGKSEVEENQVLDKEDFSQDEARQDSSIDMNAEEKESLHLGDTTNLTFTDKNDLDEDKKLNVVNDNEPSIVIKKPRGRPKKSLGSSEQPSEPKLHDTSIQAIVKKPRGRPKKSLSNLEEPNQRAVSQEKHISITTEISNECETIDNTEVTDQHSNERSEIEDNQVLDKEVFNEDEASQHSSENMNDEESLHLDDTTNLTFTNKNDLDEDKKLNIVNDNESSVVIKKPRGRPKKSLDSFEQQSEPKLHDTSVQTIVKKPRGRPKKSLSNLEQPNQQDVSQEKEILIPTEISNECGTIDNTADTDQHFDERSEVEENQVLDKENCSQDSTIDMNTEEKESLLLGDTTNLTFTDKNDLDGDKKLNVVNDNEPSVVIKKPRGRPKKSLGSSENVKKPRDGPIKSSLNDEQPNERDVSQEQDNSIATEISNECGTIDGKNEVEENQVLNKEDFSQDEACQDSSIDMNAEEKESLHLGDTTNLTFTDKNDLDEDKKLNAVNDNEPSVVIKKPRGRPKKSLGSSEQQSEPKLHDTSIQAIVKKPRGRPKKSLSNLEQSHECGASLEIEQPIASKILDSCDENNDEKGQVQHLNDTISNEASLEKDVDGYNEKLQTSNINMHAENDESLNVQAEVKTSCNENSIDHQLDGTSESQQLTLIKRARGRPKKVLHADKNKHRPTKYSYEQQQYSDKGIEERHIPGSEDNNPVEKSQLETDNEDNESLHLYDAEEENECQNEEIDNPKHDSDPIPNMDLTSSKENDEVPNDERESQILRKETDVEEGSQDLKVQDDENKENKEKYSEKDDTKEENATFVKEQDLEKPSKAEIEVSKNNTTGRKYKSFDTINTQVIVENGKRKRKPKVLLYENEDLEISTQKKKKKDTNTLSSKNESRKSLEKTQVKSLSNTNESPLDSKQNAKSTEINIKTIALKNPAQENKTMESAEKLEEVSADNSLSHVDQNTMDAKTTESSLPDVVSSQNVEEKNRIKRNRRPKTLLYENEDLTIRPKSIKKKKVEFTLPTNEDSIDSCSIENVQKYDRSVNSPSIDIKEDNRLEIVSNDCEVPTMTKKSERARKPKTLLYENESLTFTPAKENGIKFELKKEDLIIMKKFEITLEPIIVLDRITDFSYTKKYNLNGSKNPRGRSKKLENSRKNPVAKRKKTKVESTVATKSKGRPKNNKHIVKVASNPPLYECTICKESFRTYSISSFHAACVQKRFSCQFCPRKFYKATHFQYHERMHKGEKPFACDLCGKQFVQKYKLNRHLLIHKSLQDLECNECGKKFASKENLKIHLLSHVQSSFVFDCNHCPKSFSADSRRKRHELSHSPVALFKCMRCPKSFKTKYEASKHVKIHQKLRPFACHDCGKTFLTKFEVRRHAVIHSGEKKYICNHCEQQFGRIDNFNRHMQHHHPKDSMSVESPRGSFNCSTPEAYMETSSNEEKKQETKRDQSAVKPKKISRTLSNSIPMTISFAQPLTPQSVPSTYSISQNHDLASVIRETLPDRNNAVPVITAPISIQPSSSLMDPIPLEQAIILNRQIEEKIYTQNSFCEFPGLTRRNVTIVSRRPSYTYDRRNSSGSNSNSTDGTSFLTINQERFEEQQDEEEINYTKKDIHVHWRRRTAETLKSKMDQNN